MTARAPELDALSAALRALNGTHKVEIPLSPEGEQKAKWLAEGGRPLMKESPVMLEAAKRRARALLAQGKALDPAALLKALAEGVHDTVKLRIRHEGNEAGWTKDKMSTRLAKARRGQDTRTGVASGDLLREIEAAHPVVRRR